MNRLPAHTGWLWVRRGFALFRKQPVELMTLFLSYVFLMLLLGFLQIVGQILVLVLIPAFSIGFLRAAAAVDAGERVRPRLLFTGLRSPMLPRLLALGVLHLLAVTLALAVSTLVDHGIFWNMLGARGPVDPKAAHLGDLFLAMLTALAVYTPAAMALWYAAPLVHWQKMPVPKAMFYSFFAFWRAMGAFTVYGLGWLGVGLILPSFAGVLLTMLLGSVDLAKLVLLPLSITLTVVMYCSFYPTYTDVFGALEPAAVPAQDDEAPPQG
jgi:hypothetical protein